MSDIKVSVTFRHVAPTEALKRYVEQKIHRVGKFFSQPLEAHVILSVESKECQLAEMELHAHGTRLHGKEQHQNLYAAIDLIIDKIERQIKKQKDKTKLKRRKSNA
ncbi:MAG: ribosome hibernation-promoting factor, HPF/YfiA family [Chloroflexota bacterium]